MRSDVAPGRDHPTVLPRGGVPVAGRSREVGGPAVSDQLPDGRVVGLEAGGNVHSGKPQPGTHGRQYASRLTECGA
jgi:hypothetical protein